MCPKHLPTLTGLSFLLLTSCTSIRTVNSINNTRPSVVTNHQCPPVVNKKTILIGPPVYAPDTIARKDLAANIIEKGGKYVYISPSYTRTKPEIGTEKYSPEILQHKINAIKKFASENNYDTAVAFFVDMSMKSGRERFLVVNLSNNSIIKRGLVAHGKGNEKFTFDRKFSNGEGSNCTSLGIYKIGKSYNGAFGLSYKLYGLNKTNSNASKRNVVLHSMGSIPYKESQWPITQSEGCPAVSPAFLEELEPIVDNAPKNVLLYIYYGAD
jgi:L,D-transpeptidase catalytic domain